MMLTFHNPERKPIATEDDINNPNDDGIVTITNYYTGKKVSFCLYAVKTIVPYIMKVQKCDPITSFLFTGDISYLNN